MLGDAPELSEHTLVEDRSRPSKRKSIFSIAAPLVPAPEAVATLHPIHSSNPRQSEPSHIFYRTPLELQGENEYENGKSPGAIGLGLGIGAAIGPSGQVNFALIPLETSDSVFIELMK